MGFFKALGDVFQFLTTPFNDYELAIKSSKQIEGLLEDEWGAVGKGLHEKLNSVQASSQPLPDVSARCVWRWLVGRSNCGWIESVNRTDSRTNPIHPHTHPKSLVRKIRFLASVRNKLIHDPRCVVVALACCFPLACLSIQTRHAHDSPTSHIHITHQSNPQSKCTQLRPDRRPQALHCSLPELQAGAPGHSAAARLETRVRVCHHVI